ADRSAAEPIGHAALLVLERVLTGRPLGARDASAQGDHLVFRLLGLFRLREERRRAQQHQRNAQAAKSLHHALPTKPLITAGIGRPASRLVTSDASAGATSVWINGRP